MKNIKNIKMLKLFKMLEQIVGQPGILKINRAVSLTTFWRRPVWYLGMPKRRELQ